MKCPNCSTENRDQAKFCENCGQPLQRVCPNCSQPVSPNSRFCSNCGYDLTKSSATARATPVVKTQSLDALRQAAPSNVASKVLAERERLEGERKLVTALFTDIVGSTTLAEQMDPEDWREIVTGAHHRVGQAIYHYEGTIAQLLGDGLLAFFGAPITHEDDAERAIRSAIEILRSIKEYSAELKNSGRVDNFQMRVGLNTGLVVVGHIGHDLHMEYTAVGDTVNTASRMQSAADPDTILISENTHRLAARLFEYEDKGKISVKGKAEPIQVYRVIAEKKGAIRSRGITGLSSPMVGRTREYSTLLQLTTELQVGRGGMAAIIGEAGLGKSRLIAEWRKAALAEAGDEHLRWVEGRCLSYGSSMAHHLSTDILRALLQVPAGASEEETNERLVQVTNEMFGGNVQEVYPFLGHLLGLKLDDEMAARVKYLDGPALQAKYIAAYKQLLQAMAKDKPTVIICDDVHWADPSSVELGLQILPIVGEVPLIVVFVTRADRDSPGWKLIQQSHEVPGVSAIELHLAPLSEVDSRALVSNLLEVEALPENLRQLILAKAEGNPFFVEEVIRMLIDRGGITRTENKWAVTREINSIEIPDTLQGVLMARIDRLPEEAKHVLQIASVIGRKFQVQVLERVLQQTDF